VQGTTTYTDTYLYRPDGTPLELLRQQGGTTSRYWYVLDGRSNVIALTDVTGGVVDAYAYDAWGQTVGAYETVAQPFRYAGYWYDAALGWYWVSVRPYDPTLKRSRRPYKVRPLPYAFKRRPTAPTITIIGYAPRWIAGNWACYCYDDLL